MNNPFQPKVRAGLLHRMEQDGCETFSDKIRWVEEHMPNIDDPASFVAVLVRGKARNPPDRDYSELLGEGAFTTAYGKPDNESYFYGLSAKKPLDRGLRAVETVTQREGDRFPEMVASGDVSPLEIDASKIVIIAARELLKGNKRAQAYLPEIEPVRIDYTNPKTPELIFTMPVYVPWIELRKADELKIMGAKNLELAKALGKMDRDYTIEENLDDLYLDFAGSHDAQAEIKPISEALRALSQAAKKLPFNVVGSSTHADVGIDLHTGNVAVDSKGHLILLDPIVAVADLPDVEDYWQAKGWPGGPSTPAKRRR